MRHHQRPVSFDTILLSGQQFCQILNLEANHCPFGYFAINFGGCPFWVTIHFTGRVARVLRFWFLILILIFQMSLSDDTKSWLFLPRQILLDNKNPPKQMFQS